MGHGLGTTEPATQVIFTVQLVGTDIPKSLQYFPAGHCKQEVFAVLS